MSLSQEEREKLDELMKRRESGEIDAQEYRRRCNSLMQGEKEGHKVVAESAETEKKKISESKVPTVEVRQLSSPMQNSLSLRCPFGKNPTSINNNVNLSFVRTRRRLRKTRTTASHAMMFPKRNMQIVSGLMVLVVSMLITVLLIKLFVGIDLGSAEFGSSLDMPTEAYVETMRRYNGFYPLFGDIAVGHCFFVCMEAQKTETLCDAACKRLSTENYVNRVALVDPSFTADFREILSRCSNGILLKEEYSERSEWISFISLVVNNSLKESTGEKSLDISKEDYEKALRLVETNKLLSKASEQEEQLSAAVTKRLCLEANQYLTAYAAELSKASGDKVNEDYYKGLHGLLNAETQNAKNAIVTNPIVKQVLGND